jgi:hypothetical protein
MEMKYRMILQRNSATLLFVCMVTTPVLERAQCFGGMIDLNAAWQGGVN